MERFLDDVSSYRDTSSVVSSEPTHAAILNRSPHGSPRLRNLEVEVEMENITAGENMKEKEVDEKTGKKTWIQTSRASSSDIYQRQSRFPKQPNTTISRVPTSQDIALSVRHAALQLTGESTAVQSDYLIAPDVTSTENTGGTVDGPQRELSMSLSSLDTIPDIQIKQACLSLSQVLSLTSCTTSTPSQLPHSPITPVPCSTPPPPPPADVQHRMLLRDPPLPSLMHTHHRLPQNSYTHHSRVVQHPQLSDGYLTEECLAKAALIPPSQHQPPSTSEYLSYSSQVPIHSSLCVVNGDIASPQHTPLHSSAPKYTPLHTSGHQHTPLHSSAHQHTPLHSFTPKHTPLHSSAHQHTPLHSSAHQHTPLHTSGHHYPLSSADSARASGSPEPLSGASSEQSVFLAEDTPTPSLPHKSTRLRSSCTSGVYTTPSTPAAAGIAPAFFTQDSVPQDSSSSSSSSINSSSTHSSIRPLNGSSIVTPYATVHNSSILNNPQMTMSQTVAPSFLSVLYSSNTKTEPSHNLSLTTPTMEATTDEPCNEDADKDGYSSDGFSSYSPSSSLGDLTSSPPLNSYSSLSQPIHLPSPPCVNVSDYCNTAGVLQRENDMIFTIEGLAATWNTSRSNSNSS